MNSRNVAFFFVTAAAATGCFDDAKLRPATGDIGAVDVPVNPPDVPDARVDVTRTDVVADVAADALDASDADDASDAADADDAADASDVTDAMSSGCALERVLVTTTDYTNGGYALGRFAPTPSLVPSGAMSPDQDSVPVQSGCVVYNLLRGNDALAVLDPMNLPTITRRIPLRMGTDSGAPYQVNPYDVYTHSPEKAYVAQYAVPRVAVVNPTRDGVDGLLRSIDLSPLRQPEDRDMSGSMEAMGVVRAGRYVFVAMQNLNAFMPVTNGTMAVIDPNTDTLVDADTTTPTLDALRLSGRNPAAIAVTRGGRLVVAESGVVAFAPPQMLDGGIEFIDPATLRTSGLLVTEAQLGGDIATFTMLDEGRAWVVVTQRTATATSSRVIEVNLDAVDGMRVGRTIMSTVEIAAIARDPSGNVWVLDRSMGHVGARVYNNLGMELTTTALATGMYAPYGIAFVP